MTGALVVMGLLAAAWLFAEPSGEASSTPGARPLVEIIRRGAAVWVMADASRLGVMLGGAPPRAAAVASGPPREVIAEYQQTGVNFVGGKPPAIQSGGITKRAEITSLKFFGEDGRETSALATGNSLTVRLECQARERISDAVIDVLFYDAVGKLYCHFTSLATEENLNLGPGRHTYEFHCPVLGLLPGTYYVDAAIERANDPELVDWQYRCALLQVNWSKPLRGGSYMPHHFRPVVGQIETMQAPAREAACAPGKLVRAPGKVKSL